MSTFRKWTVGVIAAAVLGASVATVSQPAMAFEGYQTTHHVHHYRRRSGFGNAAAWGAAGFVGGLLLANAVAAANQPPPPPPYARATNIHTGESVEVVGVPGGRIVTHRDGNGRVTNRERRPRKTRSSASSRDPRTGITVTSVSNGNGTRTVTRYDAQGNKLSQDIVR